MANDILIDISKAAELLSVSLPTARKILGEPDKTEKTKSNLPRFRYSLKRVESERAKREKEKVCCKLSEVCRVCHKRFAKEDLTGGRCDQCRADFCLLNFCCHNCLNCDKFDCKLLQCIKNSVSKMDGTAVVR